MKKLLNKMGISNLFDKEFREMVIKTFTRLARRVDDSVRTSSERNYKKEILRAEVLFIN